MPLLLLKLILYLVSTLGQEVVVAANRTPQRIIDAPVTIERLSSSALRNAAAPNYYEALANLKGVDMHTASLLSELLLPVALLPVVIPGSIN